MNRKMKKGRDRRGRLTDPAVGSHFTLEGEHGEIFSRRLGCMVRLAGLSV